MVTIADFSSVFEIAFATNGLMYFFDVLPKIREEYADAMGKYVEAENLNYHAGYKSYCNWGQAIYFSVIEGFLRKSNIAMSVLSLALLLVGAYCPDQKIWTWLMSFVVLLVFAVPCVSFWVLKTECKALKELAEQRTRDYELGGLVQEEEVV